MGAEGKEVISSRIEALSQDVAGGKERVWMGEQGGAGSALLI